MGLLGLRWQLQVFRVLGLLGLHWHLQILRVHHLHCAHHLVVQHLSHLFVQTPAAGNELREMPDIPVMLNLWPAQQLSKLAVLGGNFVHCLSILFTYLHQTMDSSLDLHQVAFHGLVLASVVLNVKRRVADLV
eukprot:CAMPEP_0172787292 /NCGR_PEP_ID=MMETSP1074-20121228/206378_1 /TAXON_ID=2916 /ORGANISM="Ceratium fusus, Strain PA161109" /LENGTH=132 /DNA_ID=CAMNT_0013624315 /DNA_START=284 /DNA_END=682 /DNA_ORIENTATION=-